MALARVATVLLTLAVVSSCGQPIELLPPQAACAAGNTLSCVTAEANDP